MHGKQSAIRILAAGLLPAAIFPGIAAARAELRFAHAVPGAGEGRLVVIGRDGKVRDVLGSAAFGAESSYTSAITGSVRLGLEVGGKVVATTAANLLSGRHYTVVALSPSAGPKLVVVPDGRGRPGQARVRVIHAAPELGSPDVAVDGKAVVRDFRFGAVSPYLALKPGKHALGAMQPRTGKAALSISGVRLRAGSATTILVVGSRGKRTRFEVTRDPSAARVSSTSKEAKAPKATATPRKVAHKQTSNGGAATGGAHVVQRGESLWSIAAHRMGGGASDAKIASEVWRIWRMNRAHVASGDPNLILPGLRLRFS